MKVPKKRPHIWNIYPRSIGRGRVSRRIKNMQTGALNASKLLHARRRNLGRRKPNSTGLSKKFSTYAPNLTMCTTLSGPLNSHGFLPLLCLSPARPWKPWPRPTNYQNGPTRPQSTNGKLEFNRASVERSHNSNSNTFSTLLYHQHHGGVHNPP